METNAKKEKHIRFRWEEAWREDPDLRSNVRLLLFALGAYMNEHGECFPGERALARDTAYAERHVKRIRADAVESGWLRAKKGEGRPGLGGRTYRYTALFKEGEGTNVTSFGSPDSVRQTGVTVSEEVTSRSKGVTPGSKGVTSATGRGGRHVTRTRLNTSGANTSEKEHSSPSESSREVLREILSEADLKLIGSIPGFPGGDLREASWIQKCLGGGGLISEDDEPDEVTGALKNMARKGAPWRRTTFLKFVTWKYAYPNGEDWSGDPENLRPEISSLMAEFFLDDGESAELFLMDGASDENRAARETARIIDDRPEGPTGLPNPRSAPLRAKPVPFLDLSAGERAFRVSEGIYSLLEDNGLQWRPNMRKTPFEFAEKLVEDSPFTRLDLPAEIASCSAEWPTISAELADRPDEAIRRHLEKAVRRFWRANKAKFGRH